MSETTRSCPNCGQPYYEAACGPTHAVMFSAQTQKAAMDMYDALRAVVGNGYIADDSPWASQDYVSKAAIKKARAALKKARGESA